jgi:YesN/AraC family two-component response regulator
MNPLSHRILIIDDNRAIHEDFGKILGEGAAENPQLTALEDSIFGEAVPESAKEHFEICSAYQGRDGFDLVRSAESEGHPFEIAFVDVRMPPGWDGVETITHIWEVSQKMQTVICTAYSDYSWEEIIGRLGKSDRLLIIHKPVDPAEVRQLVHTLAEKWSKLQEDGNKAA